MIDNKDLNYREGYKDGLKAKVDSMKISSEETIVFYYDGNSMPYKEVFNMYKYIDDVFKKSTVVALPNNNSLKGCTKEEIKKIIIRLSELCVDD